jgi:Biotin-lipoyl like
LATLRARGPYPLLATSGEQGSAKTVLSKMLKVLNDQFVHKGDVLFTIDQDRYRLALRDAECQIAANSDPLFRVQERPL